MSLTPTDWASPDPGKNMSLADSDLFRNQLAAALSLQIGSRWVQTQYNQTISEMELRQNVNMGSIPVNLYGTLGITGCQEFNLADFRTKLRSAAHSDDPLGWLIQMLRELLPWNNSVPNMFTRLPSVQAAITSALKSI